MPYHRIRSTSGTIALAAAIALLALTGSAASWTVARAQPAAGDEVPITDAAGNELGTVVIEEVEDPFEDYREGYEPAEDTRYVLLTVAFEATGDEPFEADLNDLVLRDAAGFHWQTASVYREEDDTRPDLQSQTMAPGNRISGAVGFQVPEDAELAELFWQPESGRLVLLTDFQAGADDAAGDKGLEELGDGDDATAEPDDEDEGESETASVVGVDGNTYTSPTYGYSVSWDEELWEVGDELSEGDYDRLRLDTTVSSLYLESDVAFDGDPAACLAEDIEHNEGDADIDDFQPAAHRVAPTADGTIPDNAGIFTYVFTTEDDEELDIVRYVECRTLVPGEAVLQITFNSLARFYDVAVMEAASALATLHLPADAGIATPAAGGSNEEMAEAAVYRLTA